jgi:hypothetical protein
MYMFPLLKKLELSALKLGVFPNKSENNSTSGNAFLESNTYVSVYSMYIIQGKLAISA